MFLKRQVFERGAGQGFGFLKARGFFLNASNAKSQVELTIQHVESSRPGIAHPISLFSNPADCSRPWCLLFFFRFGFLCLFTAACLFWLLRMKLPLPEFPRRESCGVGRIGRG